MAQQHIDETRQPTANPDMAHCALCASIAGLRGAARREGLRALQQRGSERCTCGQPQIQHFLSHPHAGRLNDCEGYTPKEKTS